MSGGKSPKRPNPVAKGARLERAVRALLETDGWVVMRGAGSKGFFDSPEGTVKPDLIASKRGRANKSTLQIILIQCKVAG